VVRGAFNQEIPTIRRRAEFDSTEKQTCVGLTNVEWRTEKVWSWPGTRRALKDGGNSEPDYEPN
jgi:hypothetical protein